MIVGAVFRQVLAAADLPREAPVQKGDIAPLFGAYRVGISEDVVETHPGEQVVPSTLEDRDAAEPAARVQGAERLLVPQLVSSPEGVAGFQKVQRDRSLQGQSLVQLVVVAPLLQVRVNKRLQMRLQGQSRVEVIIYIGQVEIAPSSS